MKSIELKSIGNFPLIDRDWFAFGMDFLVCHCNYSKSRKATVDQQSVAVTAILSPSLSPKKSHSSLK